MSTAAPNPGPSTAELTIGVTGATGAIGGLVARQLAAAGRAQRLVVRDASRAPSLPNAEVRAATYADGAAMAAAFEGVDLLLLVSAAEAPDRLQQHFTAVDAAAAAGVKHVVYTSFFGASLTCTFTLGRDHYATEERLRASGMDFTFLRDNFYADFLPFFAGEDGVIRGPAGDGQLAAVARQDVAEVALAALTDPGRHANQSYDLTGPVALTLAEAAQILSTSERPISFHDETIDEAYESRARYGAEQWQLDAWVSTYTAIAAGEVARVSDDVSRILGRPATSLQQLLGASD